MNDKHKRLSDALRKNLLKRKQQQQQRKSPSQAGFSSPQSLLTDKATEKQPSDMQNFDLSFVNE